MDLAPPTTLKIKLTAEKPPITNGAFRQLSNYIDLSRQEWSFLIE